MTARARPRRRARRDHRARPGRAPRPPTPRALRELGADFWPLAMTRELDDVILDLRTNEPELGTWVLRTAGDPDSCSAMTTCCSPAPATGWPTRSCTTQAHAQAAGRDQPEPDRADRAGQLLRGLAAGAGAGRRPLVHAVRRLRGSALAPTTGHGPAASPPAVIVVGAANLGALPMGNGLGRLAHPVLRRRRGLAAVVARAGEPLDAPGGRRRSGWSRSRRTTSTGRTRSGSRSRSGPASARTR